MKIFIKNAIKSQTFKNVAIISFSKFAGAILSFFISIWIARILGKSDFGYFTLSLSVLIIVLEIIGSEAADNGLVRFTSSINNNLIKASYIIKTFLKFKAFTSLIFLFLGLTVLWITTNIYKFNVSIINAITFGIIGGCFGSLWRFSLAVLQSNEKFNCYAITNLIPNIFKFFFILLFISVGHLTLNLTLIANVTGIACGFIFGFMLTYQNFLSTENIDFEIIKEIFHFCKWIYLTNIIYALYSRLDLFILSYFRSPIEVGIYSASLNIITALDLLYVSILTVLWPAASKLSKIDDIYFHIKKQLALSLVLSMFVVPLFFSSKFFIILFYTSDYVESISIFKIMLVGYIFMILLNPFLLFFYTFKKPYILTFIYSFLILFLCLNCFLLIPKYGIFGGASALSATRILGGSLIAFFALKEIKKYEHKSKL